MMPDPPSAAALVAIESRHRAIVVRQDDQRLTLATVDAAGFAATSVRSTEIKALIVFAEHAAAGHPAAICSENDPCSSPLALALRWRSSARRKKFHDPSERRPPSGSSRSVPVRVGGTDRVAMGATGDVLRRMDYLHSDELRPTRQLLGCAARVVSVLRRYEVERAFFCRSGCWERRAALERLRSQSKTSSAGEASIRLHWTADRSFARWSKVIVNLSLARIDPHNHADHRDRKSAAGVPGIAQIDLARCAAGHRSGPIRLVREGDSAESGAPK